MADIPVCATRKKLEEDCFPVCQTNYNIWLECEKIITNAKNPKEQTCNLHFYDYQGCLDKCVAPNLFKHLK